MDKKILIVVSIVISIIFIAGFSTKFLCTWIDRAQKSPDQSSVLNVIGFTAVGFLELLLLFMMAMFYLCAF